MAGKRLTPMAAQPWTPLVPFEFLEADGRDFHAAVANFRDLTKDHQRDPSLKLADGWHTITPRMAEELLKRNTHNRPLDWLYVQQYGVDMINGRWKKTGETVIMNLNGDVEDAGHRLWACYLSGASFTTAVITQLESDPDTFAFIDNGRSRNGTDTLVTAGVGAHSNLVAKVIKTIALPFDEGRLSYVGRLPRTPCSNANILDYMRANPEITETIKTVLDQYPVAVKRIGDKATAAFIGWKIQTLYGALVLEEFFGALVSDELPANHAIAALQRRLDEHLAAKNGPRLSPKRKAILTPVKILALSIRAFNMARAGQTARKLNPGVDDAFPEFTETVNLDREAA